MRITLDRSDNSFVLVCECGWRGVEVDAQGVWQASHDHMLGVHTGDVAMGHQVQAWQRMAHRAEARMTSEGPSASHVSTDMPGNLPC